jgi:hypothetical protein
LGALLTHVNHQVRVFMASRNLSDLMGASLKHSMYLASLGSPDGDGVKTRTKKVPRLSTLPKRKS